MLSAKVIFFSLLQVFQALVSSAMSPQKKNSWRNYVLHGKGTSVMKLYSP